MLFAVLSPGSAAHRPEFWLNSSPLDPMAQCSLGLGWLGLALLALGWLGLGWLGLALWTGR